MHSWAEIFFVILATGQCANEQLLPLDTADVRSLLQNGSTLFVDKTEYALKIMQKTTTTKNFLLTRPRKFGKSTFLRTLALICEGDESKELFEHTRIYEDRNYNWKRYKVALFDFSGIGSGTAGEFERNLALKLEMMSARVPSSEAGIERQLTALIDALNEGEHEENVVVLVDEYDHPITNALVNSRHDIADANRRILKRFFATLEQVSNKLKLVFVTGVVNFAQSSVLSEGNHFRDLSMDPEFAAVAGFTREELHSHYDDYIGMIADDQAVTKDDIRDELREYYEGYKFAHEANGYVYNPYTVLKCFRNKGDMLNYWYESGSPQYLYNEMRKPERQNGPIFGETKVHRAKLGGIKSANETSMQAIMYHEGYYTIKKYDREHEHYVLQVPNAEIRDSFRKDLAERNISFKSHTPIYGRAWDWLDEVSAQNVDANVANLIDLIDSHCMQEQALHTMTKTNLREMLECILHEAGLFNIVEQFNASAFATSLLKVETYNTVTLIEVEKNCPNPLRVAELSPEVCANQLKRFCLLLGLNFSPTDRNYLPVRDYYWKLHDRLDSDSVTAANVRNRTNTMKFEERTRERPQANRTRKFKKSWKPTTKYSKGAQKPPTNEKKKFKKSRKPGGSKKDV